MGLLIAVLTFLVVLVVILGVWMFAGNEGNQEQIRKRMTAVHKAEKRGESSIGLKLVRDEMMSNVPWMHQMMMKWSWSTNLQDYVTQSGLNVKPAKLILMTLALGVGGYLVCFYFFPHFYIALPAGLAAAAIPFAYVA